MKTFLLLFVSAVSAIAQTIATFSLTDYHGVSYPAQDTSFAYTSYVSNAKMLGPNGNEVAFYQSPDKSIHVNARMPASLIPLYWQQTASRLSDHSLNLSGFTNYGNTVQWQAGDIFVLAFCPSSCPSWATLNQVLYSAAPGSDNFGVMYTDQARSSVATAINNAASNSAVWARAGWVVKDTDNTTIYAPRHTYQSGDPVNLTVLAGGTLPSPLSTATQYYACNVTATTFQLSTSAGCGSTVGAMTGGSGVWGTKNAYTWTLTTGAPSVNFSNPVTLSITTANCAATTCWALSNGLTGVTVPRTMGSPYSKGPIQALKMADATWLSNTGSVLHELNDAFTVSGYTHGTAFSSFASQSSKGYAQVVLTYTMSYGSPTLTSGAKTVSSVSLANNTITTATTLDGQGGQGTPTQTYWYTFSSSGTLPAPLVAGTPYTVAPGAGTNEWQVWDTNQANRITLTSTGTGTITIQRMLWTAGTHTYTVTIGLGANQKAIEVSSTSSGPYLDWYVNLNSGSFTPNITRFRNYSQATVGTNCGYENAFSGYSYTPSAMSVVSNVLTVTTPSPHGLATNRKVNFGKMTGVTIPAGDYTVTVTSTTQFTVPCTGCSIGTFAGSFVATYYPPWIASQTTVSNTGQQHDGYIDLATSSNRTQSLNTCGASNFRQMTSFVQVQQDAQYRNLMYNSADSSSGYVVGLTGGPTSTENSASNSGTSLYQMTSDYDASVAAIGYVLWSGGGFGSSQNRPPFTRNHMLWVDTKANLPASEQTIAPIDARANSYQYGLSKLYTYQAGFPDPAGGWKPPFVTPTQETALRTLMTGSSYYNTVVSSLGAADATMKLWNTNYAAGWTDYYMSVITSNVQALADTLVNQDNIHSAYIAFPKIPNSICGPQITLLATALADGALTAAQQAEAKQNASLCLAWTWDQDIAPTYTNTGYGFGTANTGPNYSGWANLFAVLFRTHVIGAANLQTALSALLAAGTASSASVVDAYGVPYDSSGYNAALINSASAGMQAAVVAGLLPTAAFPAWQNTCAVLTNTLTPPDPRYGAMRRTFAYGDGGNESIPYLGTLGTIFANANCLWAWDQQGNGSTYRSYVSTPFPSYATIDDSATKTQATLTTASYPSSLGVLRVAPNTNNESACLILGGSWLKDHMHGVKGHSTCYLLTVPVLDDANTFDNWTGGALTTAGGSSWHNTVNFRTAYETAIGAGWSDDYVDIAKGTTWGTDVSQAASGFAHTQTYTASWLNGTNDVWTRQIRIAAGNPAHPILHILDTFTGTNAAAQKVVNYNWNASLSGTTPSAITTPWGTINPVYRYNSSNPPAAKNGTSNPMPSNEGGVSPVTHTLAAGVNRLQFTGQTWAPLTGANRNIDFDVWMNDLDGTTACFFGHFAQQASSNTLNRTQYNTAQSVSYIQSFHMEKCMGTNPFEAVVVPRIKATSAPTVTNQACGVQVVNGTETTCLGYSQVTYADATTSSLGTSDTGSHTFSGITISGAPAEVVNAGTTLTISAQSGANANATITIPNGFTSASPIATDGGSNYVVYSGAIANSIAFDTTARTIKPLKLWAPSGSGSYRLQVSTSAPTSSTPYLVSVTAGGSVTLKMPAGTYYAQWEGGTPFTFVVQ